MRRRLQATLGCGRQSVPDHISRGMEAVYAASKGLWTPVHPGEIVRLNKLVRQLPYFRTLLDHVYNTFSGWNLNGNLSVDTVVGVGLKSWRRLVGEMRLPFYFCSRAFEEWVRQRVERSQLCDRSMQFGASLHGMASGWKRGFGLEQ